MITKLKNDIKSSALKVLQAEPSFNMYLITLIEKFDCEDEDFECWLQCIDDAIKGVLARYKTSYCIMKTPSWTRGSEELLAVRHKKRAPFDKIKKRSGNCNKKIKRRTFR